MSTPLSCKINKDESTLGLTKPSLNNALERYSNQVCGACLSL